MDKIVLFFALAILAIAPSPLAAKQPVGRAPTFSADDKGVIARNEALARLVKRNPTVLRRILEMIAAAPSQGIRNQSVSEGGERSERLPGASAPQPNPDFDPKNNPDLERLLGSSPEASHDLFQLLKQAASTKKSRPAGVK